MGKTKLRLDLLLQDAYSRQDNSKIIALCTAELRKQPKQSLLLKQRAAAFEQLELLDKAIADLDALVTLAPAPEVFSKLAELHFATGSLAEAADTMRSGLQAFPASQTLLDLQELLAARQEATLSVASQELIGWLRSHEASFAKLALAEFSHSHRGLVAAQFIRVFSKQKKERVLCVPQADVFSLDMASRTALGIRMKDLNLYSPKHSTLAVCLLFEQANTDSRWQVYLNSLPQDTTVFPVFYTDKELEWLEGSPFLRDLATRIREMDSDFAAIQAEVPGFSVFSREAFFAMRMLVSSRLFGITVNFRATVVMVPLADMLNHDNERNCRWHFCEETKQFVVEAVRNIHKGSELSVRYGSKCNSRFLLNYGFVNRHNSANEFPFRFKVSFQDPLLMQKESLLGTRARCVRARADAGHSSFFELLGALRVFCTDDEHLLELAATKFKTWDRVGALSIHVERSVLLTLITYTEKALSKYPTSAEEDQVLIQNGLTGNKLNCVLLRLGEKQVLQWYRDLAMTCLPLLDQPQVTRATLSTDSPYKSYCLNTLVSL